MGILDKYSNKELQGESTLAHKENTALEKQVDRLLAACDVWFESTRPRDLDEFRFYEEALQHIEGYTITPETINTFCANMHLEKWSGVEDETGLFISAMIQHAYNEGHTQFSLHLEHVPNKIGYVGAFLKATTKPIEVQVYGRLRGLNFADTEGVVATIHGRAGFDTGAGAKNCIINYD